MPAPPPSQPRPKSNLSQIGALLVAASAFAATAFKDKLFGAMPGWLMNALLVVLYLAALATVAWASASRTRAACWKEHDRETSEVAGKIVRSVKTGIPANKRVTIVDVDELVVHMRGEHAALTTQLAENDTAIGKIVRSITPGVPATKTLTLSDLDERVTQLLSERAELNKKLAAVDKNSEKVSQFAAALGLMETAKEEAEKQAKDAKNTLAKSEKTTERLASENRIFQQAMKDMAAAHEKQLEDERAQATQSTLEYWTPVRSLFALVLAIRPQTARVVPRKGGDAKVYLALLLQNVSPFPIFVKDAVVKWTGLSISGDKELSLNTIIGPHRNGFVELELSKKKGEDLSQLTINGDRLEYIDFTITDGSFVKVGAQGASTKFGFLPDVQTESMTKFSIVQDVPIMAALIPVPIDWREYDAP
jgi:hypothetical protein